MESNGGIKANRPNEGQKDNSELQSFYTALKLNYFVELAI